MKISGEATLHAPVEAVYAALNDPAVLVRTIPGCEQLERVGDDAYTMVVTAGVAAIKGTYAGSVALTGQDVPHAFVLTASGSGAPGTVSAEARVRLTGDGNGDTALTYDADAVVGGPVGGVGQRILAGVAKRTANEFFAAVDEVLTAGPDSAAQPPVAAGTTPPPATAGTTPPPATAETTPPSPPSGTGTGTPAAAPAVFTRPPVPAGARSRLPGGDFAAGVVTGAASALIGALVGGYLTRRPRRSERS